MLEKIKSAFAILFDGTFKSWRGFLGMAMILFSLYFLIGLFTGVASIQHYIRNLRNTKTSDTRISAKQKELSMINLHIKLIQEHSPDFVSEMAIKYLNMGDPNSSIIKK